MKKGERRKGNKKGKRRGRENKTLPLSEGFIESKEKWEGVGLMLRGQDARGSAGGLAMRLGRTETGKDRGDEEGQGGERQESRRLVGNVA